MPAPATGTAKLAHLVDPRSLGITRYVRGLTHELGRLGWTMTSPAAADIVHVHYGNSSRLLSHQPRLRKSRVVLTVHDVLPRHPLLRMLVGPRLAGSWAGAAEATIVHSQHAKELLERDAHVIPMWTTERTRAKGVRAEMGIPEDALVFGMFGRLAGHKGTHVLPILSRVAQKHPQAWLLMCGQGVGQLPNAASSRNLKLLNSPTDEQYHRAMDAIDCLLAMRTDSVGETSLPVLEALSRHIPIIHSGIGALPETAGKAGLAARDSAELENVLREFITSESLRASLRSAAAEKSREYNLGRVAHQHDAIYRSILNGAHLG